LIGRFAGEFDARDMQEFLMTKNIRLALAFAALLGAAPVLSACHTTAGVGQDLSQGGQALSNSANANAPKTPPVQ